MLPRLLSLLLALVVCAGAATQTKPMPSTNNIAPSSADNRTPPAADQRAGAPRTLDTSRAFPALRDRAEWEARRARIRRQVLISCGLYPLPPKTPLKAKIFGRVERDGYTIEKVYFQTYPGFYLAGNLYRPLQEQGTRNKGQVESAAGGAGTEPNTHAVAKLAPGILIAHGHWDEGRMTDTPNGSIPARAITSARQGCVAFTYDMVGYNDTRQIPAHRTFGADSPHWLWGISLMGLQTWNSVRALDFLASLPDVDKSRLAVTGESGGGTQTMLLGAIDDRLAATAPCVMVSHSMQGGCMCENAPGLRVDFSNMEIAAAVAPRPQIMVGAKGDWTKTMMTIEGPSVESVYKLEGQPDNLKYVIFPFNHNINKTSREAVYQFFGKTLLHDPNADAFTEPPYRRDPVADLRVFPDNTSLPPDAKTAEELTQYLRDMAVGQVENAKPHDRRGLAAFKKLYRPAWEQTLNVELPAAGQIVSDGAATQHDVTSSHLLRRTHIGRKGGGDSIPVTVLAPGERASGIAVIVAHPAGGSSLLPSADVSSSLVATLLAKGAVVVLPDLFLTGERANVQALTARHNALDSFGLYFTTYNRTDAQERVQDLLTVCAYVRSLPGIRRVVIAGMERAGAWAMLAAPAADAVAADCAQLDLTNDNALLADDLYVPCLRHMGDFRTILTLAAPHPLLLHNTGANFTAADWVRGVYAAAGAAPVFQTDAKPCSEAALAAWLTTQLSP